MPFVDGEPIDAAKLGELEVRVNKLQSSIPTFGPGDIVLNTSTTNNVISSAPQLDAGTAKNTISSVKERHPVKFKREFASIPTVVICLRGGETTNIISARVLSGTVSQTGFDYVISAPTSALKTDIAINYIAVAY